MAVGGAGAQYRDGTVRLMIQVFGVAAASAGTFVVLPELVLEDVEVGDALSGRVDADTDGGLRRGRLLRRLLRGKAERGKKDGNDRCENCELLFHGNAPY